MLVLHAEGKPDYRLKQAEAIDCEDLRVWKNANRRYFFFKDEITHDLVYTGQLPWDTTVTAGVINIFDKDPPFTRSQYNYDYTNAYFLGRTFQFGVHKKF